MMDVLNEDEDENEFEVLQTRFGNAYGSKQDESVENLYSTLAVVELCIFCYVQNIIQSLVNGQLQ